MLRPSVVAPYDYSGNPVVTTADAKAHLRVDDNASDTLIASYVLAATKYMDGYSGHLGRNICPSSMSMDFIGFSTSLMRLPLFDKPSTTTITYFDAANTQQTLDSSVYAVQVDDAGPYIKLANGKSFPTTFTRDDAVTVQWTVGAWVNAGAVPDDFKLGLKMLVAHWYENRGVIGDSAMASQMPFAVEAILSKYRRVSAT